MDKLVAKWTGYDNEFDNWIDKKDNVVKKWVFFHLISISWIRFV